ncbi:MAG: hypothetical protein AAFR98_04765 [Pseudomonadota bacterium]
MLSKTYSRILCALIFSLSAAFVSAPLAAQERIIGVDEFESISRGLTQYFYRDGEFFGAEQFFENNQTIWMFANGQCEAGTWWEEEDYICFQYETLPEAQCWHMIEKDGTYFARLRDADPNFDLELRFVDRSDIPCEGPNLGV